MLKLKTKSTAILFLSLFCSSSIFPMPPKPRQQTRDERRAWERNLRGLEGALRRGHPSADVRFRAAIDENLAGVVNNEQESIDKVMQVLELIDKIKHTNLAGQLKAYISQVGVFATEISNAITSGLIEIFRQQTVEAQQEITTQRATKTAPARQEVPPASHEGRQPSTQAAEGSKTTEGQGQPHKPRHRRKRHTRIVRYEPAAWQDSGAGPKWWEEVD